MSEITPEKVANLKDLHAAVEAGPWFLEDCEGELKIWRESVLQGVSRECDGTIVGYSTPSSYRTIDLIAEWDLDTWDDGEDEDDGERRRVAELMVESFNALPSVLAEQERLKARLEAAEWTIRQALAQVEHEEAVHVLKRYVTASETAQAEQDVTP